jgi:hypothetical protein
MPAKRPRLEHDAALSREHLAIDRSATYGSFYVYSVKPNGNGRRRPSAPGSPAPPLAPLNTAKRESNHKLLLCL